MILMMILLLGLGGGDDGLLPLHLLASLLVIRDLLSAPPSACHDEEDRVQGSNQQLITLIISKDFNAFPFAVAHGFPLLFLLILFTVLLVGRRW